MKSKFMEVWNGVEEEGPSEWWKNQPEGGKKKRGGALKKGEDLTGDFDVVKGGTLSKSEFGYVLDTGDSEGFAVKKLDQPIQEKATFKLKYRSLAKDVTKNACFCFGSSADNDKLHKAGTLIGQHKHGAFDGTWANANLGASKKDEFKAGDTFEATVTIDLEHGKVILLVGETQVEHQLPSNLESVTHIGYYAKQTKSEFSVIEKVE